MRIYLVRHTKAEKRTRWRGRDEIRPLTAEGRLQALALVELIGKAPLARIVSSPILRCRQSMEPLAAHTGLPLETDRRLAEGEDPENAIELLLEAGRRGAVLCSHGDLIPELLERLREDGLEIEGAIRCEKGSVWSIRNGDRKGLRASYLPAPEVPASQIRAAEREQRLLGVGTRLAVLDLGSTSFHLLVAEAWPTGEIRRVLRERVMLRLGSVIAQGKRIPDDVCDQAVEAARQLAKVAADARAELLLPVATAALREAGNGRMLARRLSQVLDAPVRILAGEEEARLMFAAFRCRVDLGKRSVLGLDLGGGSLEVVVGNAERVRWEATLKLGVARLHGQLQRHDPMTRPERAAIARRVQVLLSPHRTRIARLRPELCIASGGTISALARLIVSAQGVDPPRYPNGFAIAHSDLLALEEKLVACSPAERLRLPGVDALRGDLLPVGAVVLRCVSEILGLESLKVSDWGLREGVILEALGLANVQGPRSVARPRRRRATAPLARGA